MAMLSQIEMVELGEERQVEDQLLPGQETRQTESPDSSPSPDRSPVEDFCLWQSPLLLLDATFATSILVMPNAFKNVGPIANFLGTIGTGFLMLITYIGTTTLNGTMIANNLSHCLSQYTYIDVNMFQVKCCLFIVIVSISAYLHSEFLTMVSAVNNMAIPIVFGILLFYISRDKSSLEGRSPFTNQDTLSEIFSTLLCGFKSLSLILSIKPAKKNWADTPMKNIIWKTIMVICAVIIYVGIALLGYQMAESEPTDKTTRSTAEMKLDYGGPRRFLNLAIFIFHIRICFFVFNILENKYAAARLEDRPYLKHTLRTAILFITFILPTMIRGLEYVAPLFVLSGLIALGFVFPTLIYTCTFWNCMTRWERNEKMILNIFIILLGGSELIFGTWITITVIAERFS